MAQVATQHTSATQANQASSQRPSTIAPELPAQSRDSTAPDTPHSSASTTPYVSSCLPSSPVGLDNAPLAGVEPVIGVLAVRTYSGTRARPDSLTPLRKPAWARWARLPAPTSCYFPAPIPTCTSAHERCSTLIRFADSIRKSCNVPP